MNSLPVDCCNCLSNKRSFYVYLECKHFICLPCCICMANFQNFTIRCCYQNTKMSEELVTVMMQEIKKRQNQGQKLIQNALTCEIDKNQIKENLKVGKLTKTLDKIAPYNLKDTKQSFNHCIQQKKIFNLPTTPIIKRGKQNTHKEIKSKFQDILYFNDLGNDNRITFQQKPHILEKTNHLNFIQQYLQGNNMQVLTKCNLPTFKRISTQPQPDITQQNFEHNEPILKERNKFTINDRIFSKLEHQQQKLMRLIKLHHYES